MTNRTARRRARMLERMAVWTTAAMLPAALTLPHAAWALDAATLARGKALFSTAAPACAICHTLADAGAAGTIGPNLDELKPDKDVILKVLEEGMGAMPPFADILGAEDKQALADYIVKMTRP